MFEENKDDIIAAVEDDVGSDVALVRMLQTVMVWHLAVEKCLLIASTSKCRCYFDFIVLSMSTMSIESS